MRKKFVKKAAVFLLSLAAAGTMALQNGNITAAAAGQKTFLLAQAERMALSNSWDYKKKYNEVILQQVKYQEAVRSVNEKMRNMATFRWTPLLSFKFPEKPNLSEEMEFIFKPLQIQGRITTLQHELTDIKYQVVKDVKDAYHAAYVTQLKIEFTQKILEDAKRQLERNEYLLPAGKATQSDRDTAAKSVEAKEGELALLKRTFESEKTKLSDLTGFDVTSGYQFQNAMEIADIPREQLDKIVSYTMERDQGYFEAKAASAAALSNVETAERLMGGQYGGKMGTVSSYVTMVKQGKEIDTAGFQTSYNEMLKDVDRPWQGSIKILFIKIPKEWFKGQISGIRYVEDEPYLLYTACLDYIAAKKDEESARKSLENQVRSTYESVITAKNAYENYKKSVEEMGRDLERLSVLNSRGKAEYQEVHDKQAEYQAAQVEMVSALKDYNDLLTTLDRLTCGAITVYLTGESAGLEAGAGGAPVPVPVPETDLPYYYLQSRVQDMKFVFGVHIPEGFEPQVDEFELWYGKTQIGERTSVGKQLSHLSISVQNAESKVSVRFFKGGFYTDECEIDPSSLQGPLNFTKGSGTEAGQTKVVGAFQLKKDGDTGLATLSFRFNEGKIRYYLVTDQAGRPVYTGEPTPVGTPLKYLSFLENDLDRLKVILYNEEKNQIYEGSLDLAMGTVVAGSRQE